MFAKLLKYEWKATAGLLGILSLAAMGLGVLGAVVLRLLMQNISSLTNENQILVTGGLGTMLFFLFLALIGYFVATHVILIIRYYKNKFSDEGYLTFTLPVNCHQIFLSSLLNMVIWTVISGVVLAAAISIILLVGTAQKGLINTEIFEALFWDISELWANSQETMGTTMGPLQLISVIVELVAEPVIIMTCITIGAVYAKKHKILVAFGAYYLISMVSGVVSTMLMGFLSASMLSASASALEQIMEYTYLIELFLSFAMTIGGYLLSVWLMKEKLNLT